jgi:energy-coupling factor transport system permease protein
MMPGLGAPLRAQAGGSWLHRLSPIPKLAWMTAVVAFAFASYDPRPLLAVALAGLLLAASGGVAREVTRALLVLAPLAASIIVLQAIAPAVCGSTCTPLAGIGPVTIFREGLSHGVSLVARILAMETVALAILVSMRPSDLFGALTRLRVPFAFSFMVLLTLGLIPVLQREIGLVLAAQRSRGLRGSGFGAVVPAFVPVFVGAMERMQQLALGLESRGFGALGARTSCRRVGFDRGDAALAAAGVVAGFAGTAAGLAWWTADRTPVLLLPAPVAVAVFLAAAAMFVVTIAVALVGIARA